MTTKFRRIRVEEHEDGKSRRVTLHEGAGHGEDWRILAELDKWIDEVHLNNDGTVTMDFKSSVKVEVVAVDNMAVTRDSGIE